MQLKKKVIIVIFILWFLRLSAATFGYDIGLSYSNSLFRPSADIWAVGQLDPFTFGPFDISTLGYFGRGIFSQSIFIFLFFSFLHQSFKYSNDLVSNL